MDIKIKEAATENFKDIQNLNHMLFKKEYDEFDDTLNINWPVSKTGEDYYKERIKEKVGCAFVAYVDDKIVGYLIGVLEKADSTRNIDRLAELENMFVLEEYRNFGIGTYLFKAFYKWSKNSNIKRLKVISCSENKGAINFYRRNGFKDNNIILETDIK